ncbi:MAG: hypothetical protein LIR40_07755 [Bacteroidota bacterium]|nr:hypothetical protein [Bacteroidota bacterium]
MKNLEPEHRMNDLPRFLAKIQEVFGTTLINIKGKTILVIRELDIALMLAVNNKVIYVTDDAKCAEIFRKNTAAGMGNDDVVILINKWNNKLKFNMVFNKMEKKVGKKKFDAVIMNPPYDRNLHLKILETVIPHAEKVVNISPVRWLQDPFAPYSTRSDYCKFEDSISKKIESLDVISAKNASELFDASFTMNLAIYTCGQGGYNYQHNDPLITKIVEKTMEHSWAPFGVKLQHDKPQKEFILRTAEFSEILMNKTYDSQLKVKETTTFCGGRKSCIFSFNTEEERKNFYLCYTHPFMVWHTRLWKTDVHMYNEKIPYFAYFDHAWDYEDFFNWFGLTAEERVRVMCEIAEMQTEKAA